ncbi:MAG: helicase-related protein [Marinilabiliaceae bacterium]
MEETIFFTNQEEDNSLFNKMSRLFNDMPANEFLAVAGYFRSSGYFKLRETFKENEAVTLKILVGINVDKLTASYRNEINSATAQTDYADFVVDDIRHAAYRQDVEDGITQMLRDLKDGRLQMKIYKTKNLHAKFYVFLPDGFKPERGGHVIMGSSNLTDSGLGTTRPPQYEMNVDINRYGDVKFCRDEFFKLWEDGVELTADDVADMVKKTYIGQAPTPYEIFIRVLIDKFGGQVEDGFNFEMPKEIKKLSYQTDAAIQGYQTILQHNGVILADVVGLGKTIIATMIVRRFMEANGKETKTLVVTPPAVQDNWTETFKLFKLERNKHYQIVTNGSLHKVIDNEHYNYLPKEDFDLVIVDEAHTFRTSVTDSYGKLQQICKSRPSRKGHLNRDRKGVMLLSATPLNNKPEDIKNLLLLFQDSQASTIEGVTNLDSYFSEKIRAYKDIIKASKNLSATGLDELARRADALNEGIRADVLSKVTIRRTRTNILNNPDYRADLDAENVKFPVIDPPREERYDKKMDSDTDDLFFHTFSIFSKYDPDEDVDDFDHDVINYGAHRALEFLVPNVAAEVFGGRKTNGKHIAQTLAGIYRVHMVKRLESSFDAFKKSLDTFISTSERMLQMLENDDVVLNLRDEDAGEYAFEDEDFDADITDVESQQFDSTRHFRAADFDPLFEKIVKNDIDKLRSLQKRWKKENDNPKWECFKEKMGNEMLDPALNPTGKLVIFSEFVDTLESLQRLFHDDLGRDDVLMVTSKNRKNVFGKIRANFDANLPEEQREDDIKILLTSDALSEGVNLHRANVIVNYDSPWNATRLMQRIGRVNRIGSEAGHIVNYMFYPTDWSERKISLAARSVVKLQSFHSAFGEDSQIFSHEEIVHQFELFNKDVRDNVDKDLEMLRILRTLYADNRALYDQIKALPAKSRTWRSSANRPDGSSVAPRQTLVYLSNNGKKEFYQVLPGQKPCHLSFLEAIEILRADPAEPAAGQAADDQHHAAVRASIAAYHDEELREATAALTLQKVNPSGNRDSRILGSAKKFLRGVKRLSPSQEAKSLCDRLTALLESGTYSQLDNDIDKVRKRMGRDDDAISANMEAIVRVLAEQSDKVGSAAAPQAPAAEAPAAQSASMPEVVISETFVD